MIRLESRLVLEARQGSRAALSELIRSIERPIFNIAIRMLANRADAEDATQEILIKIITNLGSIRELEAAGAWALRVACRYLAHERKRGRIEAMRLTFRAFAADLEDGLAPLPENGLSEVETALAIEEVKIGCTLAMLVCLSRGLRIAYVLGDVFEVADTEAAEILEIQPDAYRQRLRRARAAVTAFVTKSCGLASAEAACRCEHRIEKALSSKRIAKGHADLAPHQENRPSLGEIQSRIRMLERGRASAALMRSNPEFTTRIGRLVIDILDAKVPAPFPLPP